VHRHLGPGLLKSAYEHYCVAHELAGLGLRFEHQRPVPLEYKGMISNAAIGSTSLSKALSSSSVDRRIRIHEAQRLTYLRLAKLQPGLLVNSRESALKNGLRWLTISPAFPASCESLQASAGFAERCGGFAADAACRARALYAIDLRVRWRTLHG
jgi:GxxExxY protein